MHRAVLQSCLRVPTFLVLVLGSNCLDISQWIYAHLSPDPLCLLSRDTEFTRWCQEDGSVKEHLAEVTTPRLRIRRLAKVTQVKSSCRGVNYISAARKARTGNKASSSSQWTRAKRQQYHERFYELPSGETISGTWWWREAFHGWTYSEKGKYLIVSSLVKIEDQIFLLQTKPGEAGKPAAHMHTTMCIVVYAFKNLCSLVVQIVVQVFLVWFMF